MKSMEGFKLRCFLDTNVLLDSLVAGRPCTESSEIILQLAKNDQIEVFLSVQSILDAAYILSRSHHYSRDKFNTEVVKLMSYVNIISSDLSDLCGAIKHDKGDLEDDVIFECADSKTCDFLITSDRLFAGFHKSASLEIIDPKDFVSRILKTCKEI